MVALQRTNVSLMLRHFWWDIDVSKNSRKTPKIIHFNRIFPYKPSILGYHYFWKHPYVCSLCGSSVIRPSPSALQGAPWASRPGVAIHVERFRDSRAASLDGPAPSFRRWNLIEKLGDFIQRKNKMPLRKMVTLHKMRQLKLDSSKGGLKRKMNLLYEALKTFAYTSM